MENLIGAAADVDELNIFIRAVKAAGLVAIMSGKGPLTVFAPTDKAFESIPPNELEGILRNRRMLRSIILYHIVKGRILASDVKRLRLAQTVEGAMVHVRSSSQMKVNDAKVLRPDIMASNGVIHVIDKVLIPG